MSNIEEKQEEPPKTMLTARRGRKPLSHKGRHVGLYDAETKKNTTIYFSVRDYPTPELMDQGVSNSKHAQIQKNAAWKARDISNTVINIPGPISEVSAPVLPDEIKNRIVTQHDIQLKLDPGTGNTTCLFGSSKRGKSTLMMYLYGKYYYENKANICALFATSAHAKVYEKTPIVKDGRIVDNERDKRLLRCGTFNARAENFIKMEKYINSKTKNKYNFINMFDDVIDTKHSRLMNALMMTFRNSNMSTMICLQYGYLLSKMNRANVNNIIIFGSNSLESILDLVKTFLRPYFIRMGIVTEPMQVEFFKYVTADHGFFYIHNATDTISFHRLKL